MLELAQDFEVIAVDQRGIGLTDKPRDGYDAGTLAGDLVALMDALGHQRFALVGHDTGYIISYALAADHPHRVDRVALAEIPGPPLPPPDSPPLFVPESLNNRLWHIPFNRVNDPLTERLVRGQEDIFFGYEFAIQAGGEFPSLGGATGWLNSEPLTAAGLRGNVVLIDFWTYTCINWLRAQPYIRAWAEKYQDRGLVTLGVHTPEFSFEHNLDNVRRAAKDLRVEYPIAIDNDYAIWRAFNNHYWPALYFVDAQGHIRHHHFGEGQYEMSEMVIQQLLTEAGSSGIGDELVSVDASDVEAAADWGSLRSPENYVGYDRTENFASPGGALLHERRVYALPARLRLNHWALSGGWTVGNEATVLNEANGRIAYCFHARDLHLVMGPAAPGTSVRFRVFIDGQPPNAAHGIDVDDQGNGTVTEQRLYQLIRQPGSIADRQFEIAFLDSGAEAYAFTFG